MSLLEVGEAIAQAQSAISGDKRFHAKQAAGALDRARKLLEADGENKILKIVENVAESTIFLTRAKQTGAAERLVAWLESACGIDDKWPDNIMHGLPAKESLDMASKALGKVLYYKGDHAGAKACYERWIVLYAKINSPPPTEALKLLGGAEPNTHQALEIMENDSEKGPNHPDTIQKLLAVCKRLGNQRGKEAEAAEMAREATRRLELDPNNMSLDLLRIKASNCLSSILIEQALYGTHPLADAVRVSSKGLVLGERVWKTAKALGDRVAHGGVLCVATELAAAYDIHGGAMMQQRNLADAEKANRRALEVLDELASGGHNVTPEMRSKYMMNLASCICATGQVTGDDGKLEYAENLMREAYSITEASHGPAHPETVKSLSALGSLLYMRGKGEDAAPLLRRCIRLTEKNPDRGKGDMIAAGARMMLAKIEAERPSPSARSAASVSDLLAGTKISNTCAACGKGKSEAEGGKLKNCAGCGIASYCSAACQKADWKRGHKAACTQARAAADKAKAARDKDHSEEELKAMGVKGLKALLVARGVDYSKAVEKSDLVKLALGK